MSTTCASLQTRLRANALSMGANYFGVADLAPVRQFVTDQGGDFLAEFPFAVSVGIALADGIVDQLYQHLNGNVTRTYYHHIYDFVAGRLDRTAGELAFQIEQAGYRAIPVPQGHPYDATRLKGLISHKLVAHLAGLGWIGKNCLLITETHGPRVRWVTVLTDAPLASTGRENEDRDRCRSCSLCVDMCPTHAFAGIPFNPGEPVEVRFKTQECRQYLEKREKTYGARACGICVYICPHGWSMKRKKNSQRTTPDLLRKRLAGVASATVAGPES